MSDAGLIGFEAGGALGLPEAELAALARAGLLGRSADDLAERIWRAALPTSCDAVGVRLRDAVEALGGGIWPAVIAALLDGRLNAYRRRGEFGGGVLAALIVSSERVVADLAPAREGDAPFIWTPT